MFLAYFDFVNGVRTCETYASKDSPIAINTKLASSNHFFRTRCEWGQVASDDNINNFSTMHMYTYIYINIYMCCLSKDSPKRYSEVPLGGSILVKSRIANHRPS